MLSKNICEAIEIVSCFSCSRPPVDPEQICKEFNIRIIDDKPLDKDGYLICKNEKRIIFVNSRINNRHRRRFIISHELGHFLLHGDQLYSCDRISEATDYPINNSLQEKEANAFASELLIPHGELSKHIPDGSINFSTIFEIAEHFDVSVTHAAIQALHSSNSESEILICYEYQKLKWYASADNSVFASMIPYKCPIDSSISGKKAYSFGAWGELYHGAVHQEVFCPYTNQHLVLLSGNRL